MNGTAGGRMKQGRFEMQGAEVTGRGFQGDSGHWADAGTHTELGKVGEGGSPERVVSRLGSRCWVQQCQ